MPCLRAMALSAVALLPPSAGCAGPGSWETRRIEETRRCLEYVAKAVYWYRADFGALPETLGRVWRAGLLTHETPYVRLLEDPHAVIVLDAWQMPILYEKGERSARLISGGRNGRIGDGDDLAQDVRP